MVADLSKSYALDKAATPGNVFPAMKIPSEAGARREPVHISLYINTL